MEEIAARFPYWMTAVLLAVGLYGIIGKRSLVKKLIGLNIMQSSVILFFVAGALRRDGAVPILFDLQPPVNADQYINPLPHVLMLTAIVVSAAITGVAVAFIVRIHREFGDLDEDKLLEQVRR